MASLLFAVEIDEVILGGAVPNSSAHLLKGKTESLSNKQLTGCAVYGVASRGDPSCKESESRQ
jgi:hypothetical protein